ncbi:MULTISPECIES: ATP-binding protein [unclassified Mesobacillus]|uniref:sensor histidine kinase n=1 Tax=unclassified Mesobacillus TaxID=2675270 RepID=UPI00203BE4C4|nr:MULTISPECIES: ATP-binding protein [unclassified Mesobacillus]MCM3124320.1 HAMP domain-containing histidine kinase [Mesobacillus sp. MER 33]MCM3234970.1 HAMP domain-containing histidine kinase [Mesobacillus sp. MER 48]
MKTKSLRREREQNIFKRTQRRLTKGFLGQLMSFLLLFSIVMFAVLYLVIMQDHEQEVKTLAKGEAERLERFLERNPERVGEFQEHELELRGPGQVFVYLISLEGDLLAGNEAFPKARPELLSALDPQELFQRKVKVDLSYEEDEEDEHEDHSELFRKDIRLLIAKEEVSVDDREIGNLYVGTDISFVYQMFTWLFGILIGLLLVFLLVAWFLSSRMSKKAMVPISSAFDRQREFVADASHELRTPLSVMLSSIDAIEMTIDDKQDHMVRKMLFNMKDEVKRMTGLVSDLLTLARSDSGKIERNDEVFDFTEVAQKAVDAMNPIAHEKQIKLQFHAPETLPGKGDEHRLMQLLYILLDNALKYTPDDGEVELALSRKQDELTIKVRDTGIGIRPEEQPYIFDRFYRADKARSRQEGSYGLGLSIAKWIVDIHHGTIVVNSEYGKGSTFVVQLPFANRS